jgi:hypothetical protein
VRAPYCGINGLHSRAEAVELFFFAGPGPVSPAGNPAPWAIITELFLSAPRRDQSAPPDR